MTAEKYERAKWAKTRENARLLHPKLKKSKIFQKGIDKVKQVWYNNRREKKMTHAHLPKAYIRG